MTKYRDTIQWLESEAASFMEEIGLRPGQHVLDFGCKQGSYTLPAARAVGPKGKVYALDKDTEALESIMHDVAVAGLNNVGIIHTQGDIQIPLEDKAVDVVFLHDVLHLIGWEEEAGKTIRRSTRKDRRRLLREVRRVMKADAVLSVFCPHLDTHTDVSSEYSLIDEILDAGFYLERECYHKLLHDGRLEEGHLCRFQKTVKYDVTESPLLFRFDLPEFQESLKQNSHHFTEVKLLTALLKPGMFALDVGANRGVTTIALSSAVGKAGRVYAFEPVPEYYAVLLQNLQQNNAYNVWPHELAITDKETTVIYYKHGEGSGIVQTEASKALYAGTTSLDHFAKTEGIERVDFINLDCEGAELFALQGAEKILQQHSPKIFCEIHRGYLFEYAQSVTDIVAFLERHGYQVLPIKVGRLEENVTLKSCTHIYAVKGDPMPSIKSLLKA